MAGEDRTEAATPRKRSELRRRGQVSKSQDLSSMIVLLGLIVCIHALGGATAARLRGFTSSALGSMQHPLLTTHTLYELGTQAGITLAQTVGPFVLTAMLLGGITCMLQTGFLVAPQALTPDLNRLNPLSGLRRFFSGRGFVEVAKACGKLLIVGWIAWSTINSGYPQIVSTIRADAAVICASVGELIYRLALRIALFLLVLAAVDYGYQRWSFEKSIRMTKQEVRQESKQTEGNPQVRARIRARQRAMSKRRMMDAVPKADVIVTNPTHYAVALRYEAHSMQAPEVVAKGADLLAQRIREIGEENDVPIVQNPQLARTLYRTVEIGREIPSELYAAVAEILAFVYQLDKRRAQR